MSLDQDWSERHRPRAFSDVVGQVAAVQGLRALARAATFKSVAITGPSGAGKTTLALIYAQACLCDAPRADGSACGQCHNCTAFAEGRNSEFDFYPPSRQRTADLIGIVEEIQPYHPQNSARRVFFFDEAARIGDRIDIILEEISRPKSPAVFIFTLIDSDDLPKPALNRLAHIPVAAAAKSDVVGMLRRVCEVEAISFEEDALGLLAGASNDFRKPVSDLQLVASVGPVTSQAVFERVLGPRFSWLLGYLRAAARLDLEGQLDALEMSSLNPSDKVDLILSALNSLRVDLVGPVRSTRASGARLIADADARAVVADFERLVAPSGRRLSALWSLMQHCWAHAPSRLSEEVVRAAAMLFHERLADFVAVVEGSGSPVSDRVAPNRASRRSSSARRPGRLFLDVEQTREIYEASTFSLQVRQAPFNMWLKLTWPKDVAAVDSVLSRRASDLMHVLQVRMRDWGYDDVGGFNRIVVNGRDREGRFVSEVVAHVPDRHVGRVRMWLERRSNGGMELLFKLHQRAGTAKAAIADHWEHVRNLWRGVDPEISVTTAGSLLDLLQVPVRRRRPAGPIAARRIALSEGLRAKAREDAATQLCEHVSFWRDGHWSDLFSGWEADEYRWRKELAETWTRNLGLLEARYGSFEHPTSEVEIKKLKQDQIDNISSRWNRRADARFKAGER
ncbi:hypothetical protein ACO2Q3_19875 [Caulobacter sp. KR2-114]|uniref:hypothetical protein n=1 Tax=Caulobacter sp. KR2-114 TaxID=3400912 RepID=UPI003C0A6A2C